MKQLHDRRRINTPINIETKTEQGWKNELVALYLTDPVYNTQLTTILTSTNDREHRGFYIDVIRLITGQTINATRTNPTNSQSSAALAHLLIGQPTRFIELSDDALFKAQEVWKTQLEAYHRNINRPVELSIKPRHLLHSRPFNLPLLCSRQSISLIRSADVDCLIAVRGSIGRTSSSRVYEFGLKYRCSKCQSEFYAYADETQENRISVPLKCAADSGKPCRSNHIEPVTSNDSIIPRDIQTAKLQQTAQRGAINQSINQSINLVFKDELVEKSKPGDEVAVVGVVRRQWASCVQESRITVELYLDVMHVEVLSSIGRNDCDSSPGPGAESLVNQSEFGAFWLIHGPKHALAARDFIISSFAPSLFGMFVPKFAALLCVIGGCTEEISSNSQTNHSLQLNSNFTQATQAVESDDSGAQRHSLRIRGDIHCLFVGDPGTGKSQLLQFASLLSRRGIFTTGAGSTSAGLTVAAVREKRKHYNSSSGSSDGGWILEPGALVLADGGVCCIDEFNGIAKADRLAIHEAMEQQTISVAKAGLVTTLHSRTSIIAALNPKGGDFDADADLTVNTALGSPLLSRFDLILVLLDTRKEEWDEKIAHYILKSLPTECDAVKKQEPEDGDDDDEERQQDEANRAVAVMGRQHCSIVHSNNQLSNPAQPSSPDGIHRNFAEVISRSLPWSTTHLRSYVAHVRERAHPALSTTCEVLLKRYYQHQRRSDTRKQARVTVRLLESLVRLTQAHARLMYRTRCIAQDAVVAVFLMENTIASCGLLNQVNNPSIWSSAITSSALHADFTEQPDLHYRQIERLLFSRLGLDYEQSQSTDEMYLYETRASDESNNQPIIQTQNSEPMYFSARSAASPSSSPDRNSRSQHDLRHHSSEGIHAYPLSGIAPSASSSVVSQLKSESRTNQRSSHFASSTHLNHDRHVVSSITLQSHPQIAERLMNSAEQEDSSNRPALRSTSEVSHISTASTFGHRPSPSRPSQRPVHDALLEKDDCTSSINPPKDISTEHTINSQRVLAQHHKIHNAPKPNSVNRFDSTFDLPDDFDIEDEALLFRAPRAPSFNPLLSQSNHQPIVSSQTNTVAAGRSTHVSSQQSTNDQAATQVTQTVYPLPALVPSTTPRNNDPIPPPPHVITNCVQVNSRDTSVKHFSLSSVATRPPLAINHVRSSNQSSVVQAVVGASKSHYTNDPSTLNRASSNFVVPGPVTSTSRTSYQTPSKQLGRPVVRSPTTNTPPPLSAITAPSRVGQRIQLDSDFRTIFNGKPFSNNPFVLAAAMQAHAAQSAEIVSQNDAHSPVPQISSHHDPSIASTESIGQESVHDGDDHMVRQSDEIVLSSESIVVDDRQLPPSITNHINHSHDPSTSFVLDLRSSSNSDDPFLLESPPLVPRRSWLTDVSNDQIDDLDLEL